jgi:hypothetical protein
VRLLTVALLATASLFLSSGAYADRYFLVPLGRKLPKDFYRLEFSFNPYNRGLLEKSLTVGMTKTIEVEIRQQELRDQGPKIAVDLSYNLLGPIADLAPGISLGVLDAEDRTADGRRFYGSITYRKIFSTVDGDANGDLTLGAFAGTHSTPFVGFNLSFSQQVRFLFEHNGYRISTGFEVRPLPALGIKFYLRDVNRLMSASWTAKF